MEKNVLNNFPKNSNKKPAASLKHFDWVNYKTKSGFNIFIVKLFNKKYKLLGNERDFDWIFKDDEVRYVMFEEIQRNLYWSYICHLCFCYNYENNTDICIIIKTTVHF